MSVTDNVSPNVPTPERGYFSADAAIESQVEISQSGGVSLSVVPPKKFPIYLIIILTFIVSIIMYVVLHSNFVDVDPTTNPSPTPASIIDPMADWQEHTIEDLGISFKYPAYLSENKDYFEFTNNSASFFGLDNLILSVKEVKNDQLDPSIWWKQQEVDPIYGDPNKCFTGIMTKLSGVDALQITSTNVTDPDCLGPHTGNIIYIVTNIQKLIVIASPVDILSTFKFVDKDDVKSLLKSTMIDLAYSTSRYGEGKENFVATVDKLQGDFAQGTITIKQPDGSPGYVWFAAYHDGQWTQVWAGQEPPSCALMDEWKFPISIFQCSEWFALDVLP